MGLLSIASMSTHIFPENQHPGCTALSGVRNCRRSKCRNGRHISSGVTGNVQNTRIDSSRSPGTTVTNSTSAARTSWRVAQVRRCRRVCKPRRRDHAALIPAYKSQPSPGFQAELAATTCRTEISDLATTHKLAAGTSRAQRCHITVSGQDKGGQVDVDRMRSRAGCRPRRMSALLDQKGVVTPSRRRWVPSSIDVEIDSSRKARGSRDIPIKYVNGTLVKHWATSSVLPTDRAAVNWSGRAVAAPVLMPCASGSARAHGRGGVRDRMPLSRPGAKVRSLSVRPGVFVRAAIAAGPEGAIARARRVDDSFLLFLGSGAAPSSRALASAVLPRLLSPVALGTVAQCHYNSAACALRSESVADATVEIRDNTGTWRGKAVTSDPRLERGVATAMCDVASSSLRSVSFVGGWLQCSRSWHVSVFAISRATAICGSWFPRFW